MKRMSLVILIALLSGCASTASTASTAPKVPYFCTFASSEEVKAAAVGVMSEVKDGPDKDKAALALALADVSADAACTAIKAMEDERAAKAKP